jgi:hypothetical protein
VILRIKLDGVHVRAYDDVVAYGLEDGALHVYDEDEDGDERIKGTLAAGAWDEVIVDREDEG